MREIFSFFRNNRTSSLADRRMLNPSCTHCRSSPQIKLTHSDGCHYLRGVRYMCLFPLAVLPAGPAQVTVLANNGTVQGREDRTH